MCWSRAAGCRATRAHDRLPALPTPQGELTIEGIATLRPARAMQLGTPAPLAPRAIVQNLEPAELARASGLDLLPLVVEQTGPATAGRMAWCASGPPRPRASSATRAMLSSGMRWRRWRSYFL
jgi:hypothetical protein